MVHTYNVMHTLLYGEVVDTAWNDINDSLLQNFLHNVKYRIMTIILYNYIYSRCIII